MSSGNDRAPNVIPCGEKAPARCIYLQEIVLVRGRDHRIKVERFETPKLACASMRTCCYACSARRPVSRFLVRLLARFVVLMSTRHLARSRGDRGLDSPTLQKPPRKPRPPFVQISIVSLGS